MMAQAQRPRCERNAPNKAQRRVADGSYASGPSGAPTDWGLQE
jgi:hypothetical protein